jgi:hypothetical protein
VKKIPAWGIAALVAAGALTGLVLCLFALIATNVMYARLVPPAQYPPTKTPLALFVDDIQ